ncbi:MAG: hypothetical protein LBS97_05105, partial [Treponema sp.]|nr:hypothetical protein [Treponema sp.]
MKKNCRRFVAAAAGLLSALAFLSCGKLDVVGQDSIASFQALLDALPGSVSPDGMNGGWSLESPDGQARFIWSKNFAESPLHDVMLEFDAAPF